MTDPVASMLDFLRDEREIWKHVNDAMIAQQLPPIARERWLERAERVTAARDQMAAMGSIAVS